uniref:Exostosin GT47 domain-containing protein n=1 Tax=Zooxanthella nutricula TaxID=1333877 RepID=A0A7S2PM69_9DINO
MARSVWCLLPLIVNVPVLVTLFARTSSAGLPGVLRYLRGPASPANPERSGVYQSWMRQGMRVFVFDAASLRPVARELFGEKSWWNTYEAWASAPATFPNQTADDPESPGAFFHSALRPALEAHAPRIQFVGSPEDADLVFWNIWDVALCVASGHRPQAWELQKGRLTTSCEAHFEMLTWLQSTPRWHRNHGRDHVLFADNPYSWESYRHFKKWRTPLPPTMPRVRDVMRITRNATLIGIEDRRTRGHRGGSSFVAVPYFANATKYRAPARQERGRLVGLAASSELHAHPTCEVCAELPHGPSELRARIFDDLSAGCAQGECEVYDLSKVISPAQRDNMSFYASVGVNLDEVVHHAIFCPIPRGDSGCTKRFFGAILAGCIPVVLSDVLVLPFASVVDYRGAMLRIPEAQLMSPDFSLIAFLRSQTPQQIATMQGNLEHIAQSITYRARRGVSSSPTPDAMDVLIASLVHLAHHPGASLGVTAAELYRGEIAVEATPVF